MFRTRAINYVIKSRNYQSYLEIGMSWPHYNYTKIFCRHKESCDPYFKSVRDMAGINRDNLPEEIKKHLTYLKTSDEMFAEMPADKKFDVIFIDGLHTEEQCSKDIVNSMAHLNPGGVIMVHDSVPFHKEWQEENTQNVTWVGGVWKAIGKLNNTNITFHTIAEDYGLTIIDYSPNPDFTNFLAPSGYDYDKDFSFDLVHFISDAEFYSLYRPTEIFKKGVPINLVACIEINSNTNLSSRFFDAHFKCIEYHKYLFSNALFVLNVDKNCSYQTIDLVKNKIYSIGFDCNISINVNEKNEYGSSVVYYNEIIKNLPKIEGITAFIDCKEELTNGNNEKEIVQDVCSHYFQMFDSIDNVKQALINSPTGICFGPFLTQDESTPCKNKWHYSEGFQWINTKKLYNYVLENNISLPLISDKNYANYFLGNILPFDTNIEGSCNCFYMEMYKNLEQNALIFDRDLYNFECFFEEICKSLCIPLNE